MSRATISYSSLKDSASEAKAVARKLDTYADNLNSSIYKKLTGYSGSHTGNIQAAKTGIQNKVSELEEKSSAYKKYSQDLSELKDKCIETDKSVKSMVSQLTATFKSNHGIKNSTVLDTINYYLTGLKNSTAVGRWLNNTVDKVKSMKDYIGQYIKVWWNYEGGKEYVKGMAEVVLTIAIAVCTIVFAGPAVLAAVAAILAGGGVTLAGASAIASVVGAGIMIFNAIRDGENEIRAYNETKYNNDPALGKRRSAENTIQDTLRREMDSQFFHNIATGIDVVELVCATLSVLNGAVGLSKNGFKWATGNVSALDDIKMKDIFSKNGGAKFFNGFKIKTKTEFANIKNAVKAKDVNFFKAKGKSISTDFMENIKSAFGDFSSTKAGASSIRNVLYGIKDVVTNGLDVGDVIKDFVIPCTTAFSVINLTTGKNGQMQFDFSKKVTAYDFYIIYERITGKIWGSPVFAGKDKNNKSVLDKLNVKSNVNIAVPEIYVPEINIS